MTPLEQKYRDEGIHEAFNMLYKSNLHPHTKAQIADIANHYWEMKSKPRTITNPATFEVYGVRTKNGASYG